MADEIKSIHSLIAAHERTHPTSKFFSSDTLKFFGETVSGMYLYKGTEKIVDVSGEAHICYRISSKQKKAPGGPKKVFHFFDAETFDEVIRV